MNERPLHPDFQRILETYDPAVRELYLSARNLVLSAFPESNELLYHTHALTSVYSLSQKLSHGFVHIPVYTAHVNLGFNLGAFLTDPDKLLAGTGKKIRHIPLRQLSDLDHSGIKALMQQAVQLAADSLSESDLRIGMTISKLPG